MRYNIIRYFTAVILIFFFGSPIFADTVLKDEITIDDGKIISTIVRTIKKMDKFPYKKGMWWGQFQKKPRKELEIISDIEITIGKESVTVPLSAYSNLADPRSIKILKKIDKIYLVISGGGEGTGYKARLEIMKFKHLKGYYVGKKKVFDRVFADDAWEETDYKFNEGNGR